MRVKFNYKRNAHQKEFHSDIESKFLHLSSGYGGGKTYALVMKMLHLSFLNRPYPGGLMCPSFTDYKRDVLPMIEHILYENKIKYKYHGTDHTIKFPWTPGKLYIVTAEKDLRGPNWSYGLINEVTLINKKRYDELVARVRLKGAKHPQIATCGTPEGIGHWLYDSFIETPMRNSRVIYGDTRDNSDNLSEDYIRSLEDSYDSITLDAYLKGMWINMSSNRFYYAYDSATNDDKSLVRTNHATIHVGIDFNVDPMSATVWEYDGRFLKGIDEITIPGGERGADTNMLCQALISRGYTPDLSVLYPDPAGQARSTKGRPDIEILKKWGFYNIKNRRKAPGMRERQLNVNNLLEKRYH